MTIANDYFPQFFSDKTLLDFFNKVEADTKPSVMDGSILENIDAYTAISLPFAFDFNYPSYGPIYKINLVSSSTENSDVSYVLLKYLVNNYILGSEDIPSLTKKLTKHMGQNWTENSVILLMETLNIYRETEIFEISQESQETILSKLAQIRASKNEINDEHWIKREVIASQRIESIYVSDEDFSE